MHLFFFQSVNLHSAAINRIEYASLLLQKSKAGVAAELWLMLRTRRIGLSLLLLVSYRVWRQACLWLLQVDSDELTESPASYRQRSTAATADIPAAGDGGPAVATFSGGGACTSRARRGETSGGACGFVRTLMEAFLVATDSSRREEHDGSLGFMRFITGVYRWWQAERGHGARLLRRRAQVRFLPSSPSSLSLSLSLSLSQALKKMEMVGKKMEMVEKKVEVVGLEKEVEMVGVVGHYRYIHGSAKK
ncbi:hypothetical protein F2Q69_00035524 [Brassica cretica]|uniref:Uncharacterized protein n=1 Tax=Brassica cretica TaxID=69181 RepID=A0A8S9S9D8_BRACR|nr:hypothetical protein F2Q69_00035524 [Brassica cretica]